MSIIHTSESEICELCERPKHYFSICYICANCFKAFKPMFDKIHKQFVRIKKPSLSTRLKFTKTQKIVWRAYRDEVNNRFKRMKENKKRLELLAFETKALTNLT